MATLVRRYNLATSGVKHTITADVLKREGFEKKFEMLTAKDGDGYGQKLAAAGMERTGVKGGKGTCRLY
jgi:hypothetical protein